MSTIIGSSRRSQDYRAKNADRFKRLDNGKFGGYRKGISNGPEATNTRRRDISKHVPHKG